MEIAGTAEDKEVKGALRRTIGKVVGALRMISCNVDVRVLTMGPCAQCKTLCADTTTASVGGVNGTAVGIGGSAGKQEIVGAQSMSSGNGDALLLTKRSHDHGTAPRTEKTT